MTGTDPASAIREHLEVVSETLTSLVPAIERLGELIVATLAGGGTVYTFGNGGSSADAEHLVGELIGRYDATRRPLRAVALTSNAAVATCIANDFGFEDLFARQVEALAKPRDLVIGFTTSGTSPNVVAGLERARANGATSVAMTGSEPGPAGAAADLVVAVPSSRTARIQEVHTLVLHLVSDRVDAWALSEGGGR